MSNFTSPLRTIQRSFKAGENDPLFRMRTDTDNLDSGARTMSNMLVMSSGAATRRPGTTCRARLTKRTRLIEFEFDANEKYICAFQDDGLEIFDKRGTLVTNFSGREGSVPWEGQDYDMWEMTVVQKADVMIICHTSFRMTRLKRTGLNSFVLEQLQFSSDADAGPLNQPYTKYFPASYTVAINDVNPGGGRVLTSSHPIFDGNWVGERIRINNKEVAVTGIYDAYRLQVHVYQKIEVELDIAPFSFTEGSNLISITHVLHGMAHLATINITGAVTTAGIDQANINGSHTIYAQDEDHYYIIAATRHPEQHAESSMEGGGSNIRISTTSPTQRWMEQVWSERRGWPGAVALHENRLWMGGSRGNPTFLASSAVGQYYDFNIREGLDDESVQGTIAALSRIQHLVSSRVLQIFTEQAEAIADTADGQPITPGTFRVVNQTSYGSNRFGAPRIFDGGTLYIQRGWKNIRDFAYDFNTDSHASVPVSFLAQHLIYTCHDLAVLNGTSVRPEQYAFIVNFGHPMAVFHSLRSDKLAAWSSFTPARAPNGVPTAANPGGRDHGYPYVDSVCVIGNDAYLSVFREGQYFLERIEFYPLDDDPPVWMDCAQVIRPAGYVSAIQLDNRYGQYRDTYVHVMAQGTLYGGTMYSDNSSIVRFPKPLLGPFVVGFDYGVTLEPNPPEKELTDGAMTGEKRRIVSTNVHLDKTVSCSVNGLDIVGYEGHLPLTERPAITGKRKIRHLGYGVDPTIVITQRSPGPLTVLGLVQEISI